MGSIMKIRVYQQFNHGSIRNTTRVWHKLSMTHSQVLLHIVRTFQVNYFWMFRHITHMWFFIYFQPLLVWSNDSLPLSSFFSLLKHSFILLKMKESLLLINLVMIAYFYFCLFLLWRDLFHNVLCRGCFFIKNITRCLCFYDKFSQ